ncbi:MAG: DUF3108 domain-containing protein [Desulfobacterales bacterium]|jgi:hypothetical protein
MKKHSTTVGRSGLSLCLGILLLLCAASVLPAPAISADTGSLFPFSPGEKLTFLLRWGVIPAGEATLEVHPPEIVDGKPANHFVLTARTNDFVDIFYKVRQRIDAYADLSMNRSLLYREVHTVHGTRRDAEIRFDWEGQKAQYVNFGKAEKPIPISPGAFDPLSIFYFSRLFDPAHRNLLARPVTDGKKCVIGRATIVGKETIDVEGKTYDTYLVEPELQEVGGVFKKSRDAKIQIWVTADQRRIPVRIRSKVVVGSFTGNLVSVESIPFENRMHSGLQHPIEP